MNLANHVECMQEDGVSDKINLSHTACALPLRSNKVLPYIKSITCIIMRYVIHTCRRIDVAGTPLDSDIIPIPTQTYDKPVGEIKFSDAVDSSRMHFTSV